jgi:hypothetical protein
MFQQFLQPGDVLAFYSPGVESWIIRLFTFFGPSHVGIIGERGGQKELFESTTRSKVKCNYFKECRNGVQVHDPLERVQECVERGGTVDVWRLVWQEKLDDIQRLKLTFLIEGYLRRRVSYNFKDAIFSGGHVFNHLDFLPVNRTEVFCSQLLHETLEILGKVSRDKSRRYNPGKLLRKLRREETYRWCTRISADNIEDVLVGDVEVAQKNEKFFQPPGGLNGDLDSSMEKV